MLGVVLLHLNSRVTLGPTILYQPSAPQPPQIHLDLLSLLALNGWLQVGLEKPFGTLGLTILVGFKSHRWSSLSSLCFFCVRPCLSFC